MRLAVFSRLWLHVFSLSVNVAQCTRICTHGLARISSGSCRGKYCTAPYKARLAHSIMSANLRQTRIRVGACTIYVDIHKCKFLNFIVCNFTILPSILSLKPWIFTKTTLKTSNLVKCRPNLIYKNLGSDGPNWRLWIKYSRTLLIRTLVIRVGLSFG